MISNILLLSLKSLLSDFKIHHSQWLSSSSKNAPDELYYQLRKYQYRKINRTVLFDFLSNSPIAALRKQKQIVPQIYQT